MYPKYPNLPLLENKFLMYLKEDNSCKHIELDGKEYPKCSFECLGVFLQTWPNTAGLFEDGGCSGQALSSYYTTVFIEHESHHIAVYQNNELVYVLTGMNKAFQEDLNNHTIEPIKIARTRYADKVEVIA